mmetsp:Transcript_26619/g.106655  ORF Transcript_26619/g.106655 Transcript_26619/m.106655 type:complete len:237 (+) Transcript_26619:1023-1733(+)
MAAKDKDRYEKERKNASAKAGGGVKKEKKGPAAVEPWDTVIPVARVKKIAKLDPEVKSVSKEATAVIAKMTEFFLAKFAHEVHVAASGKKIIKASDVANCVHHRPAFSWLRADYPMCEYAAKSRSSSDSGGKAKAAAARAAEQTASIHQFFAPAPKRPKTSSVPLLSEDDAGEGHLEESTPGPQQPPPPMGEVPPAAPTPPPPMGGFSAGPIASGLGLAADDDDDVDDDVDEDDEV